MTGDVVPVLWLCGPPGVGKTAVGWDIYSALIRSGVQTGYVDVDQLGMCYPEPAGDPGRHRMKTRNLNGVIAGYRAAGARCVVVSGVVDARHGVHRDELTQVALTVCRLRAEEEQLAQRFVGRQGHNGGLAQALQEAANLDTGTVAEVCVDTSGLTVADVARQVRDRVSGWPGLSDPQRPLSPVRSDSADGLGAGVDPDGRVLWLCGATGVGKSTIGFQVYLKVLGAGLTAAYIDLNQIGFCGPTPADHRLKARNLAALWRTYRDAGAQALVMVGPAEDEAALGVYGDALPASAVTVCRLHADRDTLTSRIMLRGQGRGSWSEPGDPLVGKPTAHLLSVADQAAQEAEALERAAIGHRIDTDRHTIAEITDLVVARTGWPDQLP
ncbi:hypothetical protein ABZ570_27535 [Micromonospora sp. NPDC007271]|uniref:hypothetical protein n=1 Tax=Micromonospora sp. NPDC007271 TaxID=3154587 RepID=UPI0033C14926